MCEHGFTGEGGIKVGFQVSAYSSGEMVVPFLEKE